MENCGIVYSQPLMTSSGSEQKPNGYFLIGKMTIYDVAIKLCALYDGNLYEASEVVPADKNLIPDHPFSVWTSHDKSYIHLSSGQFDYWLQRFECNALGERQLVYCKNVKPHGCVSITSRPIPSTKLVEVIFAVGFKGASYRTIKVFPEDKKIIPDGDITIWYTDRPILNIHTDDLSFNYYVPRAEESESLLLDNGDLHFQVIDSRPLPMNASLTILYKPMNSEFARVVYLAVYPDKIWECVNIQKIDRIKRPASDITVTEDNLYHHRLHIRSIDFELFLHSPAESYINFFLRSLRDTRRDGQKNIFHWPATRFPSKGPVCKKKGSKTGSKVGVRGQQAK